MEADVKESLSMPAEEGSVAHKVAEICLEKKQTPKALLGYDLNSPAGVTFTVDQEMIDAIQLYIDEVHSAEVELNAPAHIEEKFDLEYTSGTADAVVIGEDGAKVIDLKYGMGVEVWPDNNSQLMIYALGAIKALGGDNLPDDFEIELVIVQPRIFKDKKVKSWVTTWGELRFWEDFTLIPAAEDAMDGAGLTPGEEQCRFCKAAGECPAVTGRAKALANYQMEELPDLSIPVEEMSPEQLAAAIEMEPIFKKWVKAVEGRFSEVRERSVNTMKGGHSVPGYKLVRGRKPTSVWKDEAQMVKVAKEIGLDPYETKVLTVAKMKKQMKAEDKSSDRITDLIETPEANLVVDRADSKKAEVVITQPEELYKGE
jgi:hypothetical protein